MAEAIFAALHRARRRGDLLPLPPEYKDELLGLVAEIGQGSSTLVADYHGLK